METVTIPTPTPTWISSFDDESVAELTDSFVQKAKVDDDVTMAEIPPDELEVVEFTNVAAEDEEDEFSFAFDESGSSLISADDVDDVVIMAEIPPDEFTNVDEEEEEEGFSFAFDESGSSLISADDAFQNGQIRTSYPLFDRSILLFAGDSPHRPPVQKVFIETDDSIPPNPNPLSHGPYNAWSGKAVETASPEICKKSNSTGFSKLWRFPNLLKRSNSDGKDAYVFFHGSSSASILKKEVKTAGGIAKAKAMKSTKGKPSSAAAINGHEHYLRSKEDDRRKSYLPYRPKLMGFFTNIHGGLSRNVLPF